MKATITGKKLLVEIDLLETPTESASGKTLVIASTKGNVQTDQNFMGRNVVIGLNAYIPKK